jgi:tRNA/tmRNA/rRNA uracil-C5-methylase (TrmA/RlmC/RlmD family)
VGFVDGALPGELVATNVYQVKKNFWRGAASAVREPSADRVEGAHAGCAGCDWAHFEAAAARSAKRELFLETMRRLGGLDPAAFGETPVAASPPEYRIRTRLHVDGAEVGYFAPGSHRVVSARWCESVARDTRRLLPEAGTLFLESRGGASELSILEDIEGVRRVCRVTVSGAAAASAELADRLAPHFAGVRMVRADGPILLERGDTALPLRAGGRTFRVSVDTFFQGNRHLVGALYAAVAEEARRAPAGLALDAFGGAGLFAGALLDAGHRVVSVESDAAASSDAEATLAGWADGGHVETVGAAVSDFLARDGRRFACVVADPPRTGLGRDLAAELARRAERTLVYVSCDPATLARDLPAILGEGFAIRSAALYDLFAYTHRVEALVSLERAA